jgi:chemotaxis protein MotB
MARKHKHPEHENLERWLVSYADFMTLLFATFTALYAMAQTDAAKLKDVGAAIREGFAEQSIISGIKSILEGKSAPSSNPDPIASTQGAGAGIMGKFESMTYQPGEVKSTQHLVDDLTSDLKDISKAMHQAIVGKSANKSKPGHLDGNSGKSGHVDNETIEDPNTPIRDVDIAYQQRGVRISFDSRMLFDAGSANLRAGSEKVLIAVAKRLKQFDNRRIHVEGHTDSTAIATAQFPSNWELSASRSARVVRFFIDKGQLNPASLVAVGYGSTQPISDNRTSEGRSRNRRVDIILYNAQESMLLNPRVQFLNERPVKTKESAPRPEIPVQPPPSPNSPISTQSVKAPDQPVRVIIQEKDGTEHLWTPFSKPVKPETSLSKGSNIHETPKESHIPPSILKPKVKVQLKSPAHSPVKEAEIHSNSSNSPKTPHLKSTHPSGQSQPPVPKA